MTGAAIGSAIMRAGGAIAGSSAARSTAGSILSTGGTDALEKITSVVSKNTTKILDKVKKMVGILEKASPALKQQLIVLQKSLSVFLRPIGDILAKFVRPMAIWFLKIAVLWYKWLGGKTKIGGTGDPEDFAQVVDFNKSKDEIAAAGAESTTGSAEPAQQSFWDFLNSIPEKLKTMGQELWADFIPQAFVDVWEQLKETFSNIANVVWMAIEPFVPALDLLWDLVKVLGGTALLGALKVIQGVLWVVNRAFDGLFIVLKLGNAWLEEGVYWIGEFVKWIGEKLVAAFENVKDFFLVKIPNWVSDMIQKVKNVFSKVVDWAKSLIPAWLGGEKESKATGGEIGTTGLYQLHAGERVIPAGQSARMSSGGKNIVINNSFNIPSTISSEIDIRKLAMKLADYNEKELRRRVSYM